MKASNEVMQLNCVCIIILPVTVPIQATYDFMKEISNEQLRYFMCDSLSIAL